MPSIKRLARVMEHPKAYELWQARFVKAKLAPILRHNHINSVRRVLDVGCGPGTNAPLFTHVEYLGLDINEEYVEFARRRFRRESVRPDARSYMAPEDAKFDFILLNSLLHHLDTDDVYRVLRQVRGQLAPDGYVHILDLVLPEQRSIARFLARSDRGNFPRALEEWASIFRDVFEEVLFEPYPLKVFGVTLYNMVYSKGRAKRRGPVPCAAPASGIVAPPAEGPIKCGGPTADNPGR